MKAITRTAYGDQSVLSLQEIPAPKPQANEVLIRVHATTVNRTDCGILWGTPAIIRLFTGLIQPKHLVPGTDFAGVIEACGSAVTTFQPGDRVWGFDDNGLQSQAQFFVLHTSKAIGVIPEGISYQQAATSIEGAHYAYNYIKRMELTPTTKVFLNGATGAIGSAALQMLKNHQVEVVATANTPNLELVQSLGADRVIDYLKEDFTKGTGQYDYVFDAVGKSTFSKCKHLLKTDGAYISTELGPNAQNPFLALFTPLLGGKKVMFPIPLDIPDSITYMSQLLEAGKFRPLIDRTYSMEDIPQAYAYAHAGKKTGNVVVTYE